VDKKKLIIYGVLVFLFIALLTITYSCGHSNGNTSADNKYEARLRSIEELNTDLKNQNTDLTRINKDLTERFDSINGRLTEAKDILGDINLRSSADGDTVSRLIENLRKLEKVILTIFDSDKDI